MSVTLDDVIRVRLISFFFARIDVSSMITIRFANTEQGDISEVRYLYKRLIHPISKPLQLYKLYVVLRSLPSPAGK